jgi:5'-3' exonuclease
MGIKDFSKTFSASQILTLKQLPKGQKIAIDAMGEIYRAALGGTSIHMLTDKEGKPTMHIKVILAILIQLQLNQNEVIFCFDNIDKSILNIKANEVQKRKNKREQALRKLAEQPKKLSNISEISDSEEDIEEIKQEEKTSKVRHSMLEKQAFSLKQEQVADIIKLLTLLNYKYIIAPPGYEGEYMAVCLENRGIVDAVFSGDTDMVAFGAKTFYRRHPRNKKIYRYDQAELLKQISSDEYRATSEDIRKVCVLLGCDFVERKRGMGPKTTLKKYREVNLDTRQQDAYDFFSKELYGEIHINNADKRQFRNYNKEELLNWLAEERSFNRDRLEKQLNKCDE